MAKFNIYVEFYGTTRFHTSLEIEADTQEEALDRAEEIAQETGGDDTETVKWEEEFQGGDGDYFVGVMG
jgi:hypothetical protein